MQKFLGYDDEKIENHITEYCQRVFKNVHSKDIKTASIQLYQSRQANHITIDDAAKLKGLLESKYHKHITECGLTENEENTLQFNIQKADAALYKEDRMLNELDDNSFKYTHCTNIHLNINLFKKLDSVRYIQEISPKDFKEANSAYFQGIYNETGMINGKTILVVIHEGRYK